MNRTVLLVFAVYCYLISGLSLLAGLFFCTNTVLEKTVGLPLDQPLTNEAVLTNLGLVLLFGIQHSVMARDWFKGWWTMLIPSEVERPVYMLFSSLALALLVWKWQPLGGAIWDARSNFIGVMLRTIGFFGASISVMAIVTMLPGQFIGWGKWREDATFQKDKFRIPLLYAFIRHPMYFGFLVAIWSSPLMTASILFFNICMTAYCVVGATLEERNLVKRFGVEYINYQQDVPMLLPFFLKKRRE